MSAAIAAEPVAESAAKISEQAKEANSDVLKRQKERAQEAHSKASFVENHFGAIIVLVIFGIIIYVAWKFFGFFGGGLQALGSGIQGAGQQVDKGIVTGVNTIASDIQKGSSNIVNTVGSDIQTAGQELNKGIVNGVSTIGGDFQNAGASLSKFFGSIRL